MFVSPSLYPKATNTKTHQKLGLNSVQKHLRKSRRRKRPKRPPHILHHPRGKTIHKLHITLLPRRAEPARDRIKRLKRRWLVGAVVEEQRQRAESQRVGVERRDDLCAGVRVGLQEVVGCVEEGGDVLVCVAAEAALITQRNPREERKKMMRE